MTTEPKRKNTDYSASAVNLTNDYRLGDSLNILRTRQEQLEKLNEEARALIPAELHELIQAAEEMVKQSQGEIRQRIDEFGSFQDLTVGRYAVKQRKVSVSYDAARFKFLYPQYAPAVIVESVDTAKLKGLIKGGLLKEEDLKHPDVAVAKETEGFAYIIKV